MLTPAQLDTLEVMIRVASTLSLASLAVVLSDLSSRWPTIRFAPSRIVVWWMTSMIIPLPFMFLGRAEIPTSRNEAPSTACQLQASSISFGFMASALWATLLALNVYLVVVRKIPVVTIRNAEWVYHLVAWGIPLLVAGVPIVFPPHSTGGEPFYGDARLWCWIASDWGEYRLWFFYVPIWIAFLITLGVYAAVCIQVSQSLPSLTGVPNLAANRQSIQARNRLSTKTAMYLAAFFFSYSGASINRVVSAFIGTEVFGLYVLHAVTIPSIGTFAALAYFGNRVLGCCPCRSRRKELLRREGDTTGHGVDGLPSDWDARSMTGQTELALTDISQPSITHSRLEQLPEQPPRVPKQGEPATIGPHRPQPWISAPAACLLRQEAIDQQNPGQTGSVAGMGTRSQVSAGPRFPLGYSAGHPYSPHSR